MMTPDLFDERYLQKGDSFIPRDSAGAARIPGSRRNNVHTSVSAALSAIGLASAHRTAIFACLKLHGEQTFHEIAARTGLEPQQVNKRTSELLEQGLIQRVAIGHTDNGKAIYWTRLSPAGRPCAVWQIK